MAPDLAGFNPDRWLPPSFPEIPTDRLAMGNLARVSRLMFSIAWPVSEFGGVAYMLPFVDAAATLQRLRHDASLSRKRLAGRAGVPVSTISRIEESTSDATLGMLDRLAAAAGFSLRIVAERIPTLADAAPIAGDACADWSLLRAAADYAATGPDEARRSIATPPATTDERALALLAATAEVIAERVGIDPPSWAATVGSLCEPWESPGTPRMKAREAAAAPIQFRDRNILFGPGAIWHDR